MRVFSLLIVCRYVRAFIAIACLVIVCLPARADTLISGTYRKGSNPAEPQPQKSKYLRTVIGGVGISDNGVRYILNLDIHRPLKRKMFVRAEFENPNGEPFVEEAEVPGRQRGLLLVHGPVKGLKVHKAYEIKVSVFELDNRTKPVDVLVQKIECYADTTGETILYNTSETAPAVAAKTAKRKSRAKR